MPTPSATTFTAAELALVTSQFPPPVLIGSNILEDYYAAAKWVNTSTGTYSGTDITDPSYPTYRAFDRLGTLQTRPTLVGGSTGYTLVFSLNPGTDGRHAADCFFLLGHNLGSLGVSCTITVSCSDTAAFTTSYTLASIVSPSSIRVIDANLNSNHERWTNISFIRVQFAFGSAPSTPPSVGEVWLGRQRLLSYNPQVPYEDRGLESDVSDFTSYSGNVTRYVKSSGRKRLQMHLESPGDDPNGLNQEAQIRSWFVECGYGTKPSMIYIPRIAALHLMLPDPSLEISVNGPFDRNTQLNFSELPPYWSQENLANGTYP